MKFTVYSYMKGTSNRGFILGSIDEVLQILDDSAMNLQSMSASRFVGPFLNTVQNWEKSLSLISEVLDVRLHLFLNSINYLICQIYVPWNLLNNSKDLNMWLTKFSTMLILYELVS